MFSINVQFESSGLDAGQVPTGLGGRVLYSSFQQGTSLPGYVRCALAGLMRTGFDVVLLTTQSELDDESLAFLRDHRIELVATINKGFDFGMWRRYLEGISDEARNSIHRLVLVNDSVVYYRDVFKDLFQQAESRGADAVSISCNRDYGYHLQSFFLYMKPRARDLFYSHIFEQDIPDVYWDVVVRMEIGLTHRMIREHLKVEPLFDYGKPFDYSYEKVVRDGLGFVKRKLLDKRYTFGQTVAFMRHDLRAFNIDYTALILKEGQMDNEFKPEWLKTRPDPDRSERNKMRRWRFAFWAWIFVSDMTLLLLAAVPSICLWSRFGWEVSILSFVICAFVLFLLRGAFRRWQVGKSVRPLPSLPPGAGF